MGIISYLANTSIALLLLDTMRNAELYVVKILRYFIFIGPPKQADISRDCTTTWRSKAASNVGSFKTCL